MENQNKSLKGADRLLEVLDLLPVSRDFEQRCLNAAEISQQVRKLRKAARGRPFERKGFRKLIEDLAVAVKINPRRVLQWFGIESPTFLADGRRAAKLAWGLELGYRQFLYHVLFEAAQLSGEPVQAIARNGQNDLDEELTLLSAMQWETEIGARIKAFERAAAEEYDARLA